MNPNWVEGQGKVGFRVYARFVLWIALIISFIWTLSIVIAPLTIPPGTVVDLDGGANRVDFGDLWAQMPPVQGFVYLLGDIECHQKSTRTIYLNGNEMPVCARDASLFLFLTIGLALAAVVRPDVSVTRVLARMLPSKYRARLDTEWRRILFGAVVAFLCLAPLAVDAGVQLFTSYESSNPVRFLTSIPAGGFIGLLIGLMIQSIYMLPSSKRNEKLDSQDSD